MDETTLRLFDRLTDAQRRQLTDTFANSHAEMAACGDVMLKSVTMLRERGCLTHEAIWNPCLFLNTVAFDLSVYVMDIAVERDPWKRRLVGRNLALLLFEIGEDVPTVFGKKFREASTRLGVTKDLLDAVGAETRRVSEFWNDNRSLLKAIRTATAAHREHDAAVLHDTIGNMDLFELLGLGLQVGVILNSLAACSQAIINRTLQTPPPECPPTR